MIAYGAGLRHHKAPHTSSDTETDVYDLIMLLLQNKLDFIYLKKCIQFQGKSKRHKIKTMKKNEVWFTLQFSPKTERLSKYFFS